MDYRLKLKTSLAYLSIATAALSTTACVPVKNAQQVVKDTFASDDPCSNNARNTGVLIGTVAGAVIANQVGDGAAAKLIGAGIGAGIGGLIGNDIDNRRCELHKISQKYKVPITSTPISYKEAGVSVQNGDSDQDDSLGLAVNLRDTGQQFKTGSADLTQKAKEYFSEIAKNYSPENTQDADQKKLAEKRKLLIIGHTDDVGDSNSNAILAEQRAKTVAKLFATHGIDEDNIHYQGAGETQPIADNRTEKGRAKNRRAEIVDLPDQSALESYLAHRKPVLAYYRPKTEGTQNSSIRTSPSNKAKSTQKKVTSKQAVTEKQSSWAFGGKKLTSGNSSVSVGDIVPREDKLAFTSLFGIGTARASSDMVYASSCSLDRPRKSGAVRSLKTGQELKLKTRDYLPGLNQTVWMGDAGKHKIALLGVAVPRDANMGIQPPKVNFYGSNKIDKSSKPKYAGTAEVNAYHGKNGVLYRLFFTDPTSPVECMDIVMPNKKPFTAKTGYLIYPSQSEIFVTTFKPAKI
jgi:outer membrane protein OmpA-like peptidoglycan-associated protein